MSIDNNSFILRLSNEILRVCFEHVAQLDRQSGCDDYNRRYGSEKERVHLGSYDQEQINAQPKGLWSLALTCRRFNSLAMPILYTTVHLNARHYFFRTIDDKQSLLSCIIDLKVKCNGQRMNGEVIKTLVTLPNLKRLDLDGVNIDPGEVDLGPSPEQAGTSSLVEISFWNLRANPEAIKRLLEWPRNLYTFNLDHMTCDNSNSTEEPNAAYSWDYANLADILQSQRQSLRVLKLGWLEDNVNQSAFSTSDYPQLHTLTLCVNHKSLVSAVSGSHSLKTLILDLHSRDATRGIYSNIDIFPVGLIVAAVARVQGPKLISEPSMFKLERIGFRAFSDDSVSPDQERKCIFGDYTRKALLIGNLLLVQTFDFQEFWVGPSGAEYTLDEVRNYCNCDKCIDWKLDFPGWS
ncbi:hypothetical protein FPOAC2_09897 [Fusarium poae]